MLTAFLVVAAIWFGPALLFAGWYLLDRWLDGLDDLHDWPNEAWLDDLIAAEETPFYDDLCFVRWENEFADGERA